MNIHEYQAKELFKSYDIPVSTGSVAYTVDEIESAVNNVSGPTWVVKAQIHAGGRGKGGGVKVVGSAEDAIVEAKKMFGMNLITPQTGPEGKLVQRLYIENGSDIKKELYLSCLVDRATSKVAFIVSKMGGMDIEKVAEETPDEITTVFIEPSTGITDLDIKTIALSLELSGPLVDQLDGLVKNLYKFFTEKDASLLEINPLIITDNDKLICLDAKVNFDDNALYRHPEIEELRDPNEEDKYELEAAKYDLAYIKLDGSIGCMVNGAGLAMASLDIIKLYGGEPANFLDVGGGASKEKVTSAFKIILSDPGVKGILVNIFGGIMRCDIIADGIVAAAKELQINVPLVVRLEGTNVDEGKNILNNSGIDIVSATDLDDAAKKIVELV
ncbi:ADP-forming succinate--CoA ligase subunit beta [Pelagibacterales bacterium]|jgi:succinyl-CoA synthetase beta subunit|nr:ADP-forming succinate--CoA ligase subunit beta [Pelagibacteraceae bacterium]MDC1366207.1 ADP-forming succinate--CoA ligase subunit beta [Pelagibacterales bacterium]MDC3263584.1 ADP-forming succinate--CoA ligase subunit beta [Pelagibacterales bacterium]